MRVVLMRFIKLVVVEMYDQLVTFSGPRHHRFLCDVSREHRVDPGFVKKVETALIPHNQVLSPKEI